MKRPIGVIVAALSTVLLSMIVGCSGSTNNGNSTSPSSSGAPSAAIANPDSFLLLNKTEPDSPELSAASKSVAPEAGTCGSLIALEDGTKTYNRNSCDSSAYKVIKVADMPKQCPADVDQIYYKGERETGVFYALCLDLAWSPEKCIRYDSLSTVVPCARPDNELEAKRVLKAAAVVVGTGSGACGDSLSIPHKIRNYTVCLNAI